MDTTEGYITLSRRFFESAWWKLPRTFSESEAWLDCIQSARFELSEHTARVGGREVEIRRGEWMASVRFLAKRWGWSEMKVRCFVAKLRKEGMVETETRSGMTIMRLVKYDRYNNTPNNAVNNTPNQLLDSELIASITQQITQSVTQTVQNAVLEQHTDNTKLKKEKNNLKKVSANAEPTESGDGSPMSAQPTQCTGPIDYDEFMIFFNETMAGSVIPLITSLGKQRRGQLNARAKEHGTEALYEVVRKTAASSFLTGGGERSFIAYFDWMFRPNNFRKILEGNYDNNRRYNNATTNQRRTSAEYIADAQRTCIEETQRIIQEAKRARGEL